MKADKLEVSYTNRITSVNLLRLNRLDRSQLFLIGQRGPLVGIGTIRWTSEPRGRPLNASCLTPASPTRASQSPEIISRHVGARNRWLTLM